MLAGTLKRQEITRNSRGSNGTVTMTDLQSDIDLMNRIARRDESAFHELYAVYGQPMYAYNLLVNLASDRTVLLSTHIVEDIGQTCRDLAILSHGQVLFRGSPQDLTRNANGHVWLYTDGGLEKSDHNLTVVSMLHLAEGTQYRLVGDTAAQYPEARPVQPGLEDGYVWLMKSSGQSIDSDAS